MPDPRDGRTPLAFDLDGQSVELDADPGRPLLEVLREDLNKTGTHWGCRNGDCGACTVLIDGEPYKTCLVPAARAEGTSITTVEGLADGSVLHPVQDAFWKKNAFQCGFCTPGHMLCAVALLRNEPAPSEEHIHDAIAGNLCRCTGYHQIVDAIKSVHDDT